MFMRWQKNKVYEQSCGKSQNRAAGYQRMLEKELSSIIIFERSTHGIRLTAQGEEFVGYAKGVLDRFDAVQNIYSGTSQKEQIFSVCLPRAGDAGKGFAAVADEVRNLASKSAEAASSTTSLTSFAAEETAASYEELSGQSRLLKDQVARFKINR